MLARRPVCVPSAQARSCTLPRAVGRSQPSLSLPSSSTHHHTSTRDKAHMAHPQHFKFVSDIMTKDVVSCAPELPLDEAYKMMYTARIGRMPVLEAKADPQSGIRKLVGMLSDRDIRLAADSPFLGEPIPKIIENLHKHTVGQIMNKAVVTVDEKDTIGDAAKMLRVSNITAAPVVNEKGDMVGIVSRTDLLDHLIRLLEPLPEQNQQAPK